MYFIPAIEPKINRLKMLYCKPRQAIFGHSSSVMYDKRHSVVPFMQYCNTKWKSSVFLKEILNLGEKCKESSTDLILHCFFFRKKYPQELAWSSLVPRIRELSEA